MLAEQNRVLIIDDDANLRTLLKLLFEHEGFDVLLASDGEVGLRLAEVSHPDVIMLDIAMPRRSGLDVYLDLQNTPATADIPILVCSAALSRTEEQRWYSLPNILQVTPKPFDINALIARIGQICQQRELATGALH
jgi:DNA-binding response OmpR family regulator